MQSFRGAHRSRTPTPPIRTPKAATAIVPWKDVDRTFFKCKRCNRIWITEHAANICECSFSPREPLSPSQRGLFETAQDWVKAQKGFSTTTTTTTTTKVTTSTRNSTTSSVKYDTE